MMISHSWMKEKDPILYQMIDRVRDIPLAPLEVPDFHLRSQEHPPKLGSVPGGCIELTFIFF